jgi:hypothetical protein
MSDFCGNPAGRRTKNSHYFDKYHFESLKFDLTQRISFGIGKLIHAGGGGQYFAYYRRRIQLNPGVDLGGGSSSSISIEDTGYEQKSEAR